MIRNMILILFVFFGMLVSAHAKFIGKHIVLIRDFWLNGQHYNLVSIVMQQSPVGGHAMTAFFEDDEYVEKLLVRVKETVFGEYYKRKVIEKGSELDQGELDASGLVDDRSSILFVTAHNDLSRIYGILRAS
ncbi:MAG: hypothetical protein KDD25_06965, partial [Bdellovibrionales bacterium]|nr:hypothetical protein [Bdellovibrionales bacterium]